MRIAVTGPQNTGKSTFIKDFLAHFRDYTSPQMSYNEVVKEIGLPVNRETNETTQSTILEHLHNQIVNHEGKNVIFDRCVIDNYAYSRAGHLRSNISKELLLATKRKMYEHLRHIDCILFIPTAAGVKLEASTLRDIDPDFVDLINRIFMEALFDIAQRTHIPIFVITGNREERIKLVKEHLL